VKKEETKKQKRCFMSILQRGLSSSQCTSWQSAWHTQRDDLQYFWINEKRLCLNLKQQL